MRETTAGLPRPAHPLVILAMCVTLATSLGACAPKTTADEKAGYEPPQLDQEQLQSGLPSGHPALGTTATDTGTPEEEVEPEAATLPDPTIVIKVSPGRSGEPLHVDVVEGEYKLVGGTTLWVGSSGDFSEKSLTFPKRLGIDVTGGKIKLKGKSYPSGTKLIVDDSGKLVSR